MENARELFQIMTRRFGLLNKTSFASEEMMSR